MHRQREGLVVVFVVVVVATAKFIVVVVVRAATFIVVISVRGATAVVAARPRHDAAATDLCALFGGDAVMGHRRRSRG
jgi:hypothetical protein